MSLKHEIIAGELRRPRQALLPVAAAVGGMAVPAAIYLCFNAGLPTVSGFGIPMSTDIAFVIGILAVLGSRVPSSLKVFLTALAVVDDLGAILVIALFYTADFNLYFFLGALAVALALFLFSRYSRRHHVWFYVAGGVLLWFLVLESGIHASITGILLAAAVPFRQMGHDGYFSPSSMWVHRLHRPVYFFVLPLFVLANTALVITSDAFSHLLSPHAVGIMAGLLLGKPLGIFLGAWLLVRLRWATLPLSLSWRHVVGGGFLGGIGFTMSIFVTLLSFSSTALVTSAKLSILLASSLAAGIGAWILSRSRPTPDQTNPL